LLPVLSALQLKHHLLLSNLEEELAYLSDSDLRGVFDLLHELIDGLHPLDVFQDDR